MSELKRSTLIPEISLSDMIRKALKPKSKHKNDSNGLQPQTDVIDALEYTIKLLFECTQFQGYITKTFYPKYNQMTRCSNNHEHADELIIDNAVLPFWHGFCDDTNLKELLRTQNEFEPDGTQCVICKYNLFIANIDNKPYLEVCNMLTCPSSILVMLFLFLCKQH